MAPTGAMGGTGAITAALAPIEQKAGADFRLRDAAPWQQFYGTANGDLP